MLTYYIHKIHKLLNIEIIKQRHLWLGSKAINNNSDIHKDKGYKLKSQVKTCILGGKTWVRKVNRKHLSSPSGVAGTVSLSKRFLCQPSQTEKGLGCITLHDGSKSNFKAALINTFILTRGQMTIRNVKKDEKELQQFFFLFWFYWLQL